MTEMPDDLPAGEREPLERLASRLQADRPAPAAEFRGELGRAVVEDARRRRVRARPAGLWWQVAALCTTGAAVLAAAATQL